MEQRLHRRRGHAPLPRPAGGQLACRRCPVHGRLQLACSDGYGTCTISNGCTAEGYYYGTHLEGTYDCGGNPVGVLAFGPR